MHAADRNVNAVIGHARDIMAPAEKYGIGEQVRQLIQIGGAIEKTHVDPAKAKDGLEIISALKPLDVEPEGIPAFVEAVYVKAGHQHLSPESFVKIAKGMYDMGIREPKDYRALFEEVIKQGNQLRALQDSVSDYHPKAADSKRSMARAQ